MLPQSSPYNTASSGVSIGFPDVCKVPAPVGFTPIPYPTIAPTARKIQQKSKVTGKQVVVKNAGLKRSMGDAMGLSRSIVSSRQGEITRIKGLLGDLHNKLQAMESRNPDDWQKVLTDYAVAAGALFVSKTVDD